MRQWLVVAALSLVVSVSGCGGGAGGDGGPTVSGASAISATGALVSTSVVTETESTYFRATGGTFAGRWRDDRGRGPARVAVGRADGRAGIERVRFDAGRLRLVVAHARAPGHY